MENFESLPVETQEEILNGPALEAPDGIRPNFDNHPNHNTLALTVIVINAVLVSVSGLLRLYSKLFITKNLFIEDCGLTVLPILSFYAFYHGLIIFYY